MMMNKNKTTTLLLIAMLFSCFTTFAQTAEIRGMYVSDVTGWLGNTTEENKILNYAQGNNYNYIAFYGLGSINWSSSTKKSQLASFMSRARSQYGIEQFGATGETYSFFLNNIIPYNSGRPSDERFDVLNFEFEFWVTSSVANLYCSKYLSPNGYSCNRSGAWAFAWSEFKRIDDLAAQKGLISEIYLGWPSTSEVQSIAGRADRILLHAYRQDDSDCYAYSRNRLKDIAGIGSTSDIIPIFSAEDDFMGGGYLDNHDVWEPYEEYAEDLDNETSSWKQYIDLDGYHWFTYKHLPHTIPSTPPPSTAVATISASGPLNFCAGGNVVLTANSGYQYLWYPGGQTTRSITVTQSGSYSVRVTNASGQNATSTPAVVTVGSGGSGSAPTITASGSLTFCPGSRVTLTSSPASSYQWSNGATTQSINVSASGSYTVTTNNGGCGGTSAPVVVNSNSTPATPTITVTSGSSGSCSGPVTLTSSPSNGYLWSNGATTQSITVSSGTYTVRAYTGPSCFATSAPKTVSSGSAMPAPTISASGSLNLTSSHPTVTLTSSLADSYQWSNGSTSRSITVSTQGSYYVTATNNGGCSATSIVVQVSANGCTPPPVPSVTLSGSNVLQAGQTVTLTSSIAGGYLWSTGQTTRSITVSAAGTYTVRNYNKGYCFSTSLPINIFSIPARLSDDIALEENGPASVTAFPNPATDVLNLSFTAQTPSAYSIKLIDMTGREVSSQDISAIQGENRVEFNVAELRSGIYFGYLVGEGRQTTVKVMVE